MKIVVLIAAIAAASSVGAAVPRAEFVGTGPSTMAAGYSDSHIRANATKTAPTADAPKKENQTGEGDDHSAGTALLAAGVAVMAFVASRRRLDR